MKKYPFLISISIILLVGLAGCGHQSNQQNHAKDKAAISANMANDSSSSAASSSSSSQLSHYQYDVPKKAKQSKNYVASGNLTKKQQFSYDRFGTRQRLAKVADSPQPLKLGAMTYHVSRVRVLKNTAVTSIAKQAVQQVLNLREVPDTYYTFVVNYSVTNNHNFPIALNGVKAVKTNQNQTLTPNNQLTDSSAGNKIASGKTASFSMTGYLYNYDTAPASTLTINFGPTFNEKGTQVDSISNKALTIDLN